MEEFGDGLVESWRSKLKKPGWEPIKTQSRGSKRVEYSVDLKLTQVHFTVGSFASSGNSFDCVTKSIPLPNHQKNKKYINN